MSYGAGVRAGMGLGGTLGLGRARLFGCPVVAGLVLGSAVGVGRPIPGLALSYDKAAAARIMDAARPGGLTSTPPAPPLPPKL